MKHASRGVLAQLCHPPVEQLWTNDLHGLKPGFLLCKSRLIIFCGGLNAGHPKNMPTSSPPEPINVTLLEKGAFADVTKLRILRSPWITQVGPKSSNKDLHERCQEGRRHREKGISLSEDKDRGGIIQSQAKKCLEPPEPAGGKEGFYPQSLWRQCGPDGTLISDSGLQNCEKRNLQSFFQTTKFVMVC